jgi:hypothetical protein
MARTVENIQAEINAQVQNTPQFGVLSTSKTAMWRLWTYIVASAIRLLEVLFDNHKQDVLAALAKLKPHTTRWYQAKALNYQHGYTLPDGEDNYDNLNLSDNDIAIAQIVKYAAVIERGDKVEIKVAKYASGFPFVLDAAELAGFSNYINDIKDAGVKVEIISAQSDNLRVTLDVYYDGKVLDATGVRLDGTDSTSVQTAVKSFLNQLPFNGVFVIADLVDALQKVEGVRIPVVRLCQASFILSPLVWFNIDAYWITYSGYILIDNVDLNINFIEYDL